MKREGMTALEAAGLSARLALALLLAVAAPANAQVASCDQPDPEDARQVYACMMSARHKGRDQIGVFERSSISSCHMAASLYNDALRRSGYRRGEIESLTPSCRVLAQALEQVRGNPLPWADCTDYPGRFDAAHMKRCLDTFVPRYWGGRKVLRGCADAIDEYERALRDATLFADGRRLKAGLPPGYERPACDAVAAAGIATQGRMAAGTIPRAAPSRPQPGPESAPIPAPPETAASAPAPASTPASPCANYEPGSAHMQRCLGAQATRYSSCIDMRRAYEAEVRQAYGGQLPPDYVPLTCEETKPLVDAAQAQREERRAATQAAVRQQALARQRELDSAPKTWSEVFYRLVDMRAVYGHVGLAAVFLFIASRKIKSGAWQVPIRHWRYVLSPELKNLHYLAQGALFAYGFFYLGSAAAWNWKWLWALPAALIAGMTLTLVMLFAGFFDGPAGRGPMAGPIHGGPPMPRPSAPRTPAAPGKESRKGGGWFD